MELEPVINFLQKDFTAANWTGIVLPVFLAIFSWMIGKSWESIKSIRNKDLTSFIGDYIGYHISPLYFKEEKVVRTTVKIYRTISGVIGIKIHYSGDRKPYKGVGYAKHGIVYFDVRDPHNKHNETLLFRNVISQNINVTVGVYAAVTVLYDPCCGLQVFSKNELSVSQLKVIIGDIPTLVVKNNEVLSSLIERDML